MTEDEGAFTVDEAMMDAIDAAAQEAEDRAWAASVRERHEIADAEGQSPYWAEAELPPPQRSVWECMPHSDLDRWRAQQGHFADPAEDEEP